MFLSNTTGIYKFCTDLVVFDREREDNLYVSCIFLSFSRLSSLMTRMSFHMFCRTGCRFSPLPFSLRRYMSCCCTLWPVSAVIAWPLTSSY